MTEAPLTPLRHVIREVSTDGFFHSISPSVSVILIDLELSVLTA